MPSMTGVARSLFSACLAGVNGDKPVPPANSDKAREQALGRVLGPFFQAGKTTWADLTRQVASRSPRTLDTSSRVGFATNRSTLNPLRPHFVIRTYDQDLLSQYRTRVHDPRARMKGPDCEVPVTRAGVPEPTPLNQLLDACEEAIKQGLEPVAYGEKPERLTRLIRIAREIRNTVREGSPDLHRFDPDIVLDACACEPEKGLVQLTAEDIAALLAFTLFQKAMTVSPTLRASIVMDPAAPIRREAGQMEAALRRGNESAAETETGRNPAGFRPVAGSRGPRDERRSAFDQSKV